MTCPHKNTERRSVCCGAKPTHPDGSCCGLCSDNADFGEVCNDCGESWIDGRPEAVEAPETFRPDE